MKIFTKRKFIHKLIIAFVCITLFNFCAPPKVEAANFGGEMMAVIKPFVTAIADVIGTVIQYAMTGEWIDAVDKAGTGNASNQEYFVKQGKFEYPILQISPEVIFANKVEFLDANFITSSEDERADPDKYFLKAKEGETLQKLRNIIAGWYVTLRTISVVGLLSVLIYIGIRIIISSTSADKAKYKQRLVDWIVAFCLLFFMHYIMAATVTVVDKVNEMLANMANVTEGISIDPEFGTVLYEGGDEQLGDILSSTGLGQDNATETIYTLIDIDATNIKGLGFKNSFSVVKNFNSNVVKLERSENIDNKFEEKYTIVDQDDNTKILAWVRIELDIIKVGTNSLVTGGNVYYFNHSDVGNILDVTRAKEYLDSIPRILDSSNFEFDNITVDNVDNTSGTSMVTSLKGKQVRVANSAINDGSKVLYFTNYARLFINGRATDENATTLIAYIIIYVALITFTAVFAFRYIKRVIYIAFLTLIAPTVALTYPLDKIKDRKSTSMEYVV